MIEICDKRNCTGCGACINACPKGIISFKEDKEGFFYPYVEKEKCIDCHLCEKACPFLNDNKKNNNVSPSFFAAQLKNTTELNEVSSGGAFWALAQTVLLEDGCVYGAVQDNVDYIHHVRTESIDEAKKTRRSKYFQSNTGLTFKYAKEDLKNGRLVLFSGTPCQIAGLIQYLGKDYPNLYTCEVVCHGVPSRKVWRQYRKEKEEQTGKRIKELIFRDKSYGWSKNHYKIIYEDGTEEKELSTKQAFHSGYLNGLFYRPSCGSCKFAKIPRISDITLADYWRYIGKFHQKNDIGVSLVTVNTNKGSELLDRSKKFLNIEETSKTEALESCCHLDAHPCENPLRAKFFRVFEKNGYCSAAKKITSNYYIPNIIAKIKRRLFKR